jgi:hypothetical protein
VRTLVGVLGDPPAWLRRLEGPQLAATTLLPDALPRSALTWPDVDVVLWPSPRATDLDEPTARALLSWVLAGGRLIAGTAPEEPSALAESGLGRVVAAGDDLAPAGLGAAVQVAADLARHPPPPDLAVAPEPAPWIGEPLDRWPAHETSFDVFVRTWLVRRGEAPAPPTAMIAVVLGAYLLLTGPVEWLRHRLASRRGRRPRASALLHVGLLTAAVAAVLASTRGLAAGRVAAVRLDVIDVDSVTGAARGRSYLLTRQRRPGWQELSSAGLVHLPAGAARGDDRYGSRPATAPALLSTASSGPGALHGALRAEAGAWAALTWTAAFEPQLDGELIEALRAGRAPEGQARRRHEEPAAEELKDELLRWSRECWSGALDDLDALLSCGQYACARAGRAGLEPFEPPWPPGEPALLLGEHRARGPELLLDGQPLRPRAATLWRVRFSEQAP